MRGTVILSKDKIYAIVEIIEAMEKNVGSIREVEISFGKIYRMVLPLIGSSQ